MDASDWDTRYGTGQNPWSDLPNGTVRERLAAAEPGTGIELACGNGRNTRWLAHRGWRMTGVDFSPVAIEQAGSGDTSSTTNWIVADATQWQPDTPVDLVLIAFLHLPVNDLVAVLQRAATWLTPTGRLLYIGHAHENPTRGAGGPQDPTIQPTIADLAHAANGYAVHALRHVFRQTSTGTAIDILLDLAPFSS